MKQRYELIAGLLVFLATIGTFLGIFGIEKYRRSKFYTIELLARQPKYGNWYPKKFTIPYGKEARILIRNTETVTHGFAVPAFNIHAKEIKAGQVVVVKFTPRERGTFPFMCTVWCSDEHMHMTGEITVE